MSKKSVPFRMGRAHLVLPLLLWIVAGCQGQPDSPLGSASRTANPAVTDSVSQPIVEPPTIVEPTEKAEPISAPEVSEPAVAEPVAEISPQEEPESFGQGMADKEPPAEPPRKKLDFGEPLVEGLGENERLAPKEPIWLTKDRKSVVIQSMVCQREAPLEMFACLLGSKEHESGTGGSGEGILRARWTLGRWSETGQARELGSEVHSTNGD